MILDLHVHSIFSVDSPVKPEDYARRMVELRAEYDVDGFALMEHNLLVTKEECDLEALSNEYGLVILGGVEIDTHWGHLLVFGMTEGVWKKIQENGARKQEPMELARAIADGGGVLVPAHPFRGWIGTGERCAQLPGVSIIEAINGANSEEENAPAIKLAQKRGYSTTGGSDAHFVGELGNAMTRLSAPVQNMEELVTQLKAGRCEAVTLDEVRKE